MHGLDPSTDLRPLWGASLTYVGFGQYSVHLAFSGDEDCSISVEGDYRMSLPQGGPATYSESAAGSTALLRLLGRTVESATVPEDGTVRIVFGDASVLELLDSSSEYESYQLSLGSRLIVV